MATSQGASRRFLSCLLTFSLYAAAFSHVTSTGLTVTLNDIYYFISPFPWGKVDAPSSLLTGVPTVFGFKLVTVIQEPVPESDIRQLLLNWTVIDDVYQPSFSEAIFLARPGAKRRARSKMDIFPGASSSIVPLKGSKVVSGPYFLEVATGSLYPVYRLYEDFAGAFTEPLLPTPDGGFQPLSAKIPGSSTLTVGVPSRLYFTKTAEKPLAGVRLGVKDIFRLAGVKGSNGNRAWYSLYPRSNVTGTAVQRLIDAGAQIVGLQKTSQFANGEFATVEWVDYHAPFNPRGDGYNDASSSSSGAGASIASYEWLDIAIGSDTGGSIRGPAGVQGLFGNRPSHGLVSLDHVMPLSPSLDTPGFVVRDPYLWDDANAALWGENYTSFANTEPQYPKKIYTLDFPTAPKTPAEKLLFNFTNVLAEFVAGNVTSLDLEGEWAATKPASAGNVTLDQLLNTTYATLISKDQTALVRDPFYRDYAATHQNRLPFINPVPLHRWAYADSLPASALAAAHAAKSLFQSWFTTHILPPPPSHHQKEAKDQKCTAPQTLLLYPAALAVPLPRNLYWPGPFLPFGFTASRISPLAGVPDVVVPIGEVGVLSEISGVEERLPVAVSLVAARGCDGLLVRLVQELVERGLLAVPGVGGSGSGSGTGVVVGELSYY